ncbi:hypothetical protein ACCS61_36030 [Rhizobium ruizarguesonis]
MTSKSRLPSPGTVNAPLIVASARLYGVVEAEEVSSGVIFGAAGIYHPKFLFVKIDDLMVITCSFRGAAN